MTFSTQLSPQSKGLPVQPGGKRSSAPNRLMTFYANRQGNRYSHSFWMGSVIGMLTLLLLMSGYSSLARTIAVTNTAPGSTTQPTGTQLSINKLVDKTTARIGDVLSYTLVISNVGSTTATNVVARDSSTTGLRYVSGSASVPAGSTFSSGAPISTWTVPSIGAGQSFSLTFQAIADSSGILYTKATIPGDTATVCTSVPIKVCTGDTYLFRLTAAPGRSNYKWFKNGVELTTQTTNVLDVTATGAYTLAIDNVSGRCPDFSCCPFVVEEDTLPTFRATILPVTCVNGTAQTNGQITLTNYNPAYTYQYSAGADFNAAVSLSGSPKSIPAGGVIANNLSNPGSVQPYTIRVFNASGCYTDVTVTMQPTGCCSLSAVATAGICQSATNTYSATTVVTLTNSTTGILTVSNGPQSTTFATTATPAASFTAVFANLLSDGGSHTVTASLPGCSTATTTYTSPVSCSVVPAPTVGLSITPGICQSATNGYILTGTLSLTNAIAGTATITDGSSTTIAITAGTTSVPYSLTGLSSGTGSHTVSVSYASQTISQTYTAPLSCSVTPAPTLALSLLPGDCQPATNTYLISGTLSLTNASAGTATLTDGNATTTVLVSAGATSLPYSLSGLISGTNTHTLSVSYASQTVSTTYTAPASCSTTSAPSPSVVLSVTPGNCQTATNGYTISGILGLTNAIAGTATITDGTSTTTVSVSTGISSIPYSLSGLSSGTGSHTLTVAYASLAISQTYTAPLSCSVSAAPMLGLSVVPGNCQSATNGYILTGTLSLTNASAGTATITDGSSSTTVSVNAGATNVPYSVPDLVSGTGSHTITVSYASQTLSQTYTAPASCSVTPAPTLSLSVIPGNCQTATNGYTVTGTLSLTDAVSGTATITDGTATVTLTVDAKQTSLPYSLTGLISGTGSHTLTVSYTSQTISQTYTAPLSCTTALVCSLSAVATTGVCAPATNTFSVSVAVSLTNTEAGTLTVSLPGSPVFSQTITTATRSVTALFTGLLSDAVSHTATISLPGCATTTATYTAPASCSLAPAPTLTLSVTPGDCQSATNGYTVSGTLSLTNAIAGTATVTDGNVTTTVSVSAGATSVPYSLSGLMSGTGSHSLSVGYATQALSTTYTAPLSCTTAPVCSLSATVTAGVCQSATNTYSSTVVITITNPTTATLTVTNAGQTQLLGVTSATTSVTAVFADMVSDGIMHTVAVSLPGCPSLTTTYSAPVSCRITTHTDLSVSEPGMCDPATNTYVTTGIISLTNATAGTATVTDGSSTTLITISAGAISVPYSLSGLTSGTGLHTVTVSYLGQTASATYAAPASCSVAAAPTLALNVTPGTCQSATNGYTISGTLSLTNATAGTATLTDGSTSTTLSVNADATNVPYSLSGLVSGSGSHTVTVSYASQTISQTYTAPLSCSVSIAPVCSLSAAVTAGVCQSATNTHSATAVITLTNPTAGILMVSNGPQSITFATGANSVRFTAVFENLLSDSLIHMVTASLPGCSMATVTYTAPASCSVTPAPTLVLSVTPSDCQPTTNSYSISGMLSLTNASAAPATITDGTATATIPVKAGDTALPYSLLGLVSGSGSHTITVTYLSQTSSQTYTAPLSCSVTPVCSLSATVLVSACAPVTNTFSTSVVVSLTNIGEGIITVSLPGLPPFSQAVKSDTRFLTAIFDGLLSDGASHTATVSLPGCATTTATFAAPASCSVAVPVTPVCSLSAVVTAGACQSATNTYSATAVITLTNSTTGVLTVSNGPQSTTFTTTANSTSFTAVFENLASDSTIYTITASLPGCSTATAAYTAPASCSVAPIPSLALSVTPGDCQSATNGYTISGTLSLTNAIVGTATLTDGNATTTVSVSAGATSLPYSLSGLISGTNTHTLSVSYASQTLSTTYTAPISCSVIPVPNPSLALSVTPGICQSATNGYTLTGTINLTNAITGTATLTDGFSTTTVSINAGAALVPYSLTGLSSGTGSHTLTVSYVSQTISQTYTAPLSCTAAVVPVCSVSAVAKAIAVTCQDNVTQANGQIVLSDFNPTYTYQYSAGTTFDPAISLSGPAKAVPINGVIVNTLANPAANQPYTVRVYGKGDCYTDVTLVLKPVVCDCIADVCIPFVIEQSKRAKRIGDAR